MNKPKLLEQKHFQCKILPKFEKNLFDRIYFNKFHAIFKRKFQKCDHWFGNTFTFCTDIRLWCISIERKKSYIHVKNLKHMTIARINFYLSIKYFFVFS
jgi:hypothetical protein